MHTDITSAPHDRYLAEESRGCWVVRDTQAAQHKAELYPHVGLREHEARRLADALNGHRIGT